MNQIPESMIDVRDMLERLEIRNIHSASGGRELNFSCPFEGHSHGDENPSAYMNVRTTKFFCWGCKARGNAASFTARLMNIDINVAVRWLEEAYGFDFEEPRGGSMRAEIEERFAERQATLEERLRPTQDQIRRMDFDWLHDPLGLPQQYMIDRGFRLDTLQIWRVGFDEISARITIPVEDEQRNIIGFKGRGWMADQDPKYKVLGDRPGAPGGRYWFDMYDTTSTIFGLGRWIEAGVTDLVLCEGELDAIALWQAGVLGGVATGMSYFSEEHARLMIEHATRVTIFYDTDTAGIEGTLSIVDYLEPYVPVFIVADHEGDPASMQEEEIQELITNARSSLQIFLPS